MSGSGNSGWGRRLLLLPVAALALVAVLWGLTRLGFNLPLSAQAMGHGPLFVQGVFTTVIALERAVALGKRWGYGAPLLGVLGAAALVHELAIAPWLSVAAILWLGVVNGALLRRQVAAFTLLMLLGTVVLGAGALGLALGRSPFQTVPLWMAFFVLTILAERLELSRLAPTPSWALRLLVLLCALYTACSAGLSGGLPYTAELTGALLMALGGWALRFDLARRTVRLPGVPGFAGSGVLLGNGWLVVAGMLLVWQGLPEGGRHYDAILHAVFVGFVLSMVFAHAPIILPAVARIALPFHPALYAPLGLLHLGLGVRIAGDLAANHGLRQAGGVVNALSLAGFLGAVLWARTRTQAACAASAQVRTG